MNIVLMLAHEVEEAQQVQLMHELGHQVFSIGAYIDPASPGGDGKRAPLPQVPFHRQLAEAVWATPTPPDNPDTLWAAKDTLPQAVIDWADAIICHHVEWRWLLGNWPRIRDKRVIWRTVGQSTHENEARMGPLVRQGLQIVRYSPRERSIPYFAGEDALIRFWADPDEWTGWHGLDGHDRYVGNVTQDMRGREPWTGYGFWDAATDGLPRMPAGPRSEDWGGLGALSLPDLREYLRGIGAYLYTGTFPASYTLGLIEAMMTGVPVVAAGPERWVRDFSALPYGWRLYEAHQIAPLAADTPANARGLLKRLLGEPEWAAEIGAQSRTIALELFGKARIKAQWADFLGDASVAAVAA